MTRKRAMTIAAKIARDIVANENNKNKEAIRPVEEVIADEIQLILGSYDHDQYREDMGT